MSEDRPTWGEWRAMWGYVSYWIMAAFVLAAAARCGWDCSGDAVRIGERIVEGS